ncbi:hypothetical protein AMTRI_Chr04g187600 [Amborella trichopoda]|uniref:FAF domain-containing protein n=1 Tax=Amborella trichopoda TaxID=13333 RepID=W1NTS0_AMBTC|nr:protein FAF-like, chloroplastic [Amborella trichopoda]ERN00967.1 hypothetical protein AMTR_s00002p00087350 [Amborella trichopoda]|eukprot:XP_006838398.1 protein FAF-like, chloroplastic [Amborella trichopoda]
MAAAVCRGFQSYVEEGKGGEPPGIGSILVGSQPSQEKTPKTQSLRRSFSADESSKFWLSQQQQPPQLASPPFKKTASSEQLCTPQEHREIEHEEREREKDRFDIWSSIVSGRKRLEAPVASAPYSPPKPLFRRTWSSLSLNLCTEGLGSETGSDTMSEKDYGSCLSSDSDEPTSPKLSAPSRLRRAVTYPGRSARRVQGARSFPPPLTSISRRDGPCVHMRPHRVDGRLVLEAVPVPSHNYLHAQRGNGRLRLTFAATHPSRESEEESENEDEEIHQEIVERESKELGVGFGEREEEEESLQSMEEGEEIEEREERVEERGERRGFVERDAWMSEKGIRAPWVGVGSDRGEDFTPRRCNDSSRPLLLLHSFCVATT